MPEAMPSNLQLEEQAFVRRVYYARASQGETLDVVLDPGFWVNLAGNFRINDELKVIADDGSYEWHGRIVRKGPTALYFRELLRWERPAGAEEAPAKPVARIKAAA